MLKAGSQILQYTSGVPEELLCHLIKGYFADITPIICLNIYINRRSVNSKIDSFFDFFYFFQQIYGHQRVEHWKLIRECSRNFRLSLNKKPVFDE